ncbi:MAG: HAMP domain-containing histidine kinase [Deltaproteobacteria bacterium]|nr:HAMP domain-containing histidine kinase [Deltaproteobacteria bacterium]MCW5808971.1 HAMP domain-containing histidine kinase [Deltaproteobacteria bacterium]
MPRPPAIPERNWVNIQWLARLRWAEIAGQASTVLVGQFLLDGRLPITQLFLVIGIGLVSNLALELYFFGDRRREIVASNPRRREVHEWQIAVVMMVDVAILTGLLYLTGGPTNPFGLLYVVQIALATVLLTARWAWVLTGLSFLGYGLLLLASDELKIPDDNRAIGAWVALGVAAAFVVHFLQRITGALAEREEELTQARGLAARQERLASLATMAAGAAHELSTPLGTVALAAKELERALVKSSDPALAEDARLIREQVGRCRAILEQMAQGAGTVGESVAACTVGELLDETMVGIRPGPTVHRDLPGELARSTLRLPPRAVSQALRSLVTNAQDASPATVAVVVTVREDGPTLSIAIRDRGPGMPSEVLARIGEPFFTTKAPGRGMGLGLFLARAVIEGVGGSLIIDSTAGEGTEVRVTLPRDVSSQVAGPRTARSRESGSRAVVSKPA